MIEQKACFNYLNRETVCQACKDVCPTNAIYFENKLPVINQSSCINCGACVSQCPSLAIDHIQKPYHYIKEQIDQFPNANITCEKHEKYQKGIKVPCYLYLDLSFILNYGHNKETITFHTGKCKTCPISEFISVEEHLQKLQQELDHYQIPITIQFNEAELDDKNDQTVNGLTRRELFKQFSIKNVREAFFEKGEERETELKGLTVRERVGLKRKVFNQYILQKEMKNTNIQLPKEHFLAVEVSSTCSGCNVCESVCPTGAIQWHEQNGLSQLVFNIQECIGCEKCAICPEQSVQFSPVTLEEYKKRGSEILKTFYVKQCVECGETFRTNQETDTCSVCQARKEKNPIRFFAHKLG